MFGISGEHILIAIGILILFGPNRLPQAAATLGKAVRNFKDQWNGIKEPEYRKLEESEDSGGSHA